MENDAGTAERIEHSARFSASGSEINENLSKFRWEHTDESVASWASLIAFSVGGDVLGADRDAGIFAEFDDFDMIGFFAELVMMRCGRGKDRGFAIRDKANVATVALEHILVFESELPGFARIGVFGII